ncbi:hypothetical protein [Paramaledivibacter caminithermalis]|jgi:hypothetical protein|uniref:Replication initiation factor n=1 Tax=Paramaledivibacter caminithermalis (strain DSM 15212 / CIP 107654 / DViRD3) TaxID=1121301 RepID=A0A1M6K6D9_PARC5|nr:hypothetical protein [Paramaledivibacter caminithermalis]SHJ54495.1 hypothetical protein SAMN02745912_00284 [Paramaledivibacter caminithermalis DSM 15212]
MFIPNIDTLIATIDIEDYDIRAYALLLTLEELKEEAKNKLKESIASKVQVKIGNMTFEVLPNGSRHHAYILHNDLYEVKLARYRSSSGDSYPVFVKIKSACLWSKGYRKAWEDIKSFINKYVGEVLTNKISRLDICCHTDELQLTSSDIDRFSGKFRSDEIYRSDRKLSGFTFGSGKNKNVFCRIYNKTLEVKQKRQKTWFFDIWEKQNMDIENVWNVEFQLGRKFFKKHEIETVEKAFKQLKPMWEYCTTLWITMRDLTNTRKDRCDINETWLRLQDTFKNFEGKELITRDKQLERESEVLIPSIMGYLTTYSARSNIKDLGDSLMNVINKGLNYLENAKKSNFTIEVAKKQSLLKEC